VKGGGAFLNGRPLTGAPKDEIEFLSLEATRAALVLDRLEKLAPLTDRVRVMGAQAITFCHLAAGRTDAVVCLKPSRPVDFAGSQLLIRERGFAVHAIDGPPVPEIPLDLEARSRICAARTDELARRIAAAVRS
jgi:fructose-1,6-bisphosphatase/inositol monophosphatase family enzyme